eukprot:CAMPEP_0176134832 /NCGR_PEP_ID=MMETSP0120_2-20121206/68380_1 /TAXON_ID=160619 /ORGANISM="Kryptoperidinium foliaceum, Strain CCMP 1326" /LENGTH=271 /DNA_ID=CAMNT_0017470493 /DNA_START=21 /DNA_END=833 /DNA_ORIENTATION=-
MACAGSGVPETIGVVGVGTISSAMVRGLCSPGGPQPKIVLCPRNAAKAAALQSEFPDLVRIAGSNQEVVDAADYLILALLSNNAEEVLGGLTFRPGQGILSVIAALPMPRLQELVSPATDCAIGIPLPAVAKRRGASLLMPKQPAAQAIFDALGTCVVAEVEAEFKRMLCLTALMGDFYKRQLTAQDWMVSHGVPKESAAAWTGAIFATMAADSGAPGPTGLADLVAEQTPGGLNEMVWRGQDADRNYDAVVDSLDAVHNRITTGSWDPDL